MPAYSCSNPDCGVKSCGELWLLSEALHTGLAGALRFRLEHGIAERGEQDALEMMERFRDGIENGFLQDMESLGLPCKGLGKQVLDMIGVGICDTPRAGILRFFHTDGTIFTGSENGKGAQMKLTGKPGCFPYKTPGEEKTVYAFPSAVDALKARHLWKSAGLGNLPAYSFTGFPLPPAFAGTEKIVFANVQGRIAKPEIISDALEQHGNGVRMVKAIDLDLGGLRALMLRDADAEMKAKVKPAGLEKLGETKAGRTVYFSKKGYYVGDPKSGFPVQKTNFAFKPTKTYLSDYPTMYRLALGDLYVDGKLRKENATLPPRMRSTLGSVVQAVRLCLPGERIEIKEQTAFADFLFGDTGSKAVLFPTMPCACKDGELVFPRFRLTENGFEPHPELLQLMSDRRECHDYMALLPEEASREDLAAVMHLIRDRSPQARVATLCLCAWLYMAVSASISIARKHPMPKMCLEVHTPGKDIPAAVSFLARLLSGDPVPRNSAMYRREYAIKLKHLGVRSKDTLLSQLPGLFQVDMSREKPRNILYVRTHNPGIYAVLGSDMAFPVNAHGNIQCALKDPGGELPELDLPALRRFCLYILSKYVKSAKNLDPEKWMLEHPERFMYNSLVSALRGIGFPVPDAENPEELYIG